MPIYEFKCADCACRFDELVMGSQGLTDIRCPECKTDRVIRMMSAFGFSTGSPSLNSSGGASSCGSCSSKNCGSCSH